MEQYIEIFINYLLYEKRCSEKTAVAYRGDLESLNDYLRESSENLAGAFDVNEIRAKDLRAYVMLLSEKGMNPRSINRRITAYRTFFKHLLRLGVITQTPAALLKNLKEEKKIPDFLTITETQKILESAEPPTTEYTPENYQHLLEYTLLLTLYSTGVRRSELANITTDKIDLENQTLRIVGKGNKERVAPLTENLAKTIEELLKFQKWLGIYCENEKKTLFLSKESKALTESQIYRLVKELSRRLSLQGNCTPHTFRHTFATHLMNEDVSIRIIQQLLGHSSLSTTQIYTHTSIEKLKTEYEMAHPRAKKQ